MACNYFQIFIITVVSARITVGYERTATKTYEVQVPGSSPIRIIEADPMWHRDGYFYSPSPPPDVEHRSLSTEKIWKTQNDKKKNGFTTQQTKTTLNEPFSGVNEMSVASTTLHNPVTNLNEPITNKPKCYGSLCDDENKNVETSVDEEQFKNILKQYAENIKRPVDNMSKNENEKRDFSSSSENFEKFLKMFVEKSQTSNDLQRKNSEQDSRYFDKMLKVYTEQFEKPNDNGFQRKKMDLLSPDHDLNDRQANLDKFLKQFTETINNNENDDFHEKKLERVELFTREKHHNKDDEEDEKHKKTILRIELLQKEDETKKDRETTDKDGKSVWNLMDTKYHKHPYDDRDGWVTLDAVPWSSSKISKWQSNAKPHWSNEDGSYKPSRPSYESNRPGGYDSYKPTGFVTVRPSYDFNRPNFESNKPMYENNRPNYEAVRPAGGYNDRYGDERPWPVETPQKRPPWIKDPYEDNRHGTLSQNYQQEIITDGLPGNFPAASYNNYNIETLNGNANHKPTSVVYADISTGRPFTHPENGDGEWVLLSTTKGYQYPRNRQRALKIRPDALTSRRSIRLTVLPGDPSNTTTSHGGLLEVESTFETVDEARSQYVRNQNRNRTTKPFRPQRPNKAMRLPNTTARPPSAHSDPTAVLAAVGAGMVPATMAMLVPLALGRRRRSTSDSKDTVRTYVLHRHPPM